MADSDYRTLRMFRGDFRLLPADENGIVRHDLTQGVEAFGQRLSNRLYAVKGESPFDPTMGLPVMSLADIESDAVFASLAADALRNDHEVESIQRIDLLPQTEEEFDNAVRPISISVLGKSGLVAKLQAVV